MEQEIEMELDIYAMTIEHQFYARFKMLTRMASYRAVVFGPSAHGLCTFFPYRMCPWRFFCSFPKLRAVFLAFLFSFLHHSTSNRQWPIPPCTRPDVHSTNCPQKSFTRSLQPSTNKTLSTVPVRQSLSTSSPSRTCGAESESKQSSRKSVSKQQPPSKHSSGTRTMSAMSILTESYSPSFCHKRLPRLRVVLLRLSLALLLLLLRWSLSFQVNHAWTDSCPQFAQASSGCTCTQPVSPRTP